jgi:hypothetical protein
MGLPGSRDLPREAALLGTWSGREDLFATAWTQPAVWSAQITIAPAPGEGLLLDYEAGTSDGTALTGHGVVIGDGFWWFDSFGFVPDRPGVARWADGALVLERTSDRGFTAMTFSVRGSHLEQEIVTAVPSDAPRAPLLSGRYAQLDNDSDAGA